MIAAALPLVLGGAALAQAPARTVWDGVFTAEQATQGKAVFDSKCAICHGTELNGAEMAPALSGGAFIVNWSGSPVAELATRIRTTMPANDPDSMSRQDVALTIAYILSFNQFPAGATPLPADDAALSQIAIVADKPAK
ncbi:MAG: cytochrome c [Alphaproteobacteria bacterium]|nr:cytochrome c [Alphaproteobacteria bacterium]